MIYRSSISEPFALLDEPERQKDFREEYLSDISTIPEPASLHLQAHEFQRRLMDAIACRSNPTDVKNELARVFQRRASYLQHKKYKLLIRWAHRMNTSELIDKVCFILADIKI